MTDLRKAVSDLYAAFGKGDIPAVLAKLTPNVRWESWPDNHAQKAGVPFMRPLSGLDAVGQFFQLLSTYKFHRFDVLAVMGGERHATGLVAVKIELPTGAVFGGVPFEL